MAEGNVVDRPAGQRGRVIALDLGDARIGVAISDQDRRVAVPLTTVPMSDTWVDAIAALVRDEDASIVVVGHPLSMAGEAGARATASAASAATLRAHLDVPIVLQDERLSTVEAQRRLAAAGVRGKRQRAVIDTTSAVIILESFLASSIAQIGPDDGAGALPE